MGSGWRAPIISRPHWATLKESLADSIHGQRKGSCGVQGLGFTWALKSRKNLPFKDKVRTEGVLEGRFFKRKVGRRDALYGFKLYCF